jgi:hypothetical protein
MQHPPSLPAAPDRGATARHRGSSPRRTTRRHLRTWVLMTASGVVVLLCLAAYTVAVRGQSSTVGLDSAARFGAVKAGAASAWRARTSPGAPHTGKPSSGSGTPAPSAPTTTSAPAPVQPAVPAAGQGSVVTVPAAIAADCSRNVTGMVNDWMASVADGSTLRFGAGACYRVDGTLTLSDRRNLTLDGNGARFTTSVVPPASPKITRQMWSVTGGSGITIRNMSLHGSNPTATFTVDREWFPLLQIAGTRTALVEGVRGSNSWGDFVSIGPDVRRVTDSKGTGAVLPKDVTIRGSDVAYQILDIEVEATAWYARNVALTNNTIGGRVNLSVLANAGIGHDITGITVSGNTMSGTPVSCAPPIQIDDTSAVKSNFVITGNRFKTLGNALWLRGVSDVTVASNVVSVGNAGCTDAGVAVIATNGEGNVVRDNDFSGAQKLARPGASAIDTACGNRLSGTMFNQPEVCPGM